MTVRLRGKIVDDDRQLALHRALVHRAQELRDVVVRGVREDARVLQHRPVVEDQHPAPVERRQAELELRLPEEGAELRLERPELRVRNDRFAIDQVPLDRRQHFLVGHIHGAHDREAFDHESLGRQELQQRLDVEERRLKACAIRLGKLGALADHVHALERRIEADAEVALEPGVRIGNGDHQGIVEVQLDAVDTLEHHLVGEAQAGDAHGVGVEVQATAHVAIVPEEIATERRGFVDAHEVERHERRDVRLIPRGRREDGGHERVNDVRVLLEDRDVRDRAHELGRARDGLAHDAPQRRADGPLATGAVALPELDQWPQAERATEWECVGPLPHEEREVGGARRAVGYHASSSRSVAGPKWPRRGFSLRRRRRSAGFGEPTAELRIIVRGRRGAGQSPCLHPRSPLVY